MTAIKFRFDSSAVIKQIDICAGTENPKNNAPLKLTVKKKKPSKWRKFEEKFRINVNENDVAFSKTCYTTINVRMTVIHTSALL